MSQPTNTSTAKTARSEPPLSKERKIELQLAILAMQKVSDVYYYSAKQTNVHAFIEFCGLQNEFIKICQNALNEGIDFTTCNIHTGNVLPVRNYPASARKTSPFRAGM